MFLPVVVTANTTAKTIAASATAAAAAAVGHLKEEEKGQPIISAKKLRFKFKSFVDSLRITWFNIQNSMEIHR